MVPILFFLLVHKVSDAFPLKFLPPSGRLQPTTKIKAALFVNDDHRPTEEHGHGLPIAEAELMDERRNNDLFTSCDNAVVTRRTSLASAAAGLATLIVSHPAAAANIHDSATPINTIATAVNTANNPSDSTTKSTSNTISSLTIPLQYQPTLSAYTLSYKIGTTTFGAIVDTGSPFLVVPQNSETSCRPEYKWGCFHPEETFAVEGLEPTLERFDGNEGLVEWRQGKFVFDRTFNIMNEEKSGNGAASSSLLALNANAASTKLLDDESLLSSSYNNKEEDLQSILFPKSLMTFGVISESLMDGPGGIFLGLVKNTDDWIRPSFLGQSDVSAFSVDLRDRKDEGVVPKTLTLYAGTSSSSGVVEEKKKRRKMSVQSLFNTKMDSIIRKSSLEGMLPIENAIQCNLDLNAKYGDPTIHYVGMASSITVNGSNLASSASSKRNNKLYCIFDTGCTGMSISPSLFDERYAVARSRKEKSLWGTVDVEFPTMGGETITLSAKRPLTTPLGSERPWGKKLDGFLIVLGLAFLEGRKMTVDSDGGYVWFED